MKPAAEFDVAVVGASVAGCTAARLFAQSGARVALIERRNDPEAYKVVCTHAILPAATPVIERLGLAPLLLERGALRTRADVWTSHGSWLSLPDELPDGWGVTRRTLDPLLRDLAGGTPGVELFPGWTVRNVIADGDRPAGVEVEDRRHRRHKVRARLVVGADGRGSSVARLARVRGRVRPHNRCFYFAYWRGVQPADPIFRLWLLDPEGAAQFPMEDGLTVLVAGYHRARLPEVRADLEGAYLSYFDGLPDGPVLSGAERVSKILGKIDMPNIMRPAAKPGIAFVGDAALATDPLFGVGITFAFQSAEWLVDETQGALDDARELDRALGRYRRKFAWRLGSHHHLQIADYASGRKLNWIERLTLRRAATDPEVALAFAKVLARDSSPLALVHPRVAARLFIPQPRSQNDLPRTDPARPDHRGLRRAQHDGDPVLR